MKAESSSSEWALDLKLFKYKEQGKETPIAYSDLSTQFAADLIKIRSHANIDVINGICMLIDEIDVLEDRVQIAPFLKATVEKLRQENVNDVCFIIAGVTGIATRMIGEHKSSMRLFEACPLEPMNHDDINELLDITLEETGVVINKNATSMIADVSKNLPQPVQLLGYHSFKLDSNDVIDVDDVTNAMQFIIENIRGQEFRHQLNELTKDEAVILRAASRACRTTFNIGYISSRTRLNELEIVNIIASLKEKGIIETRFNEAYTFVDLFFKNFIKWDSTGA